MALSGMLRDRNSLYIPPSVCTHVVALISGPLMGATENSTIQREVIKQTKHNSDGV